MSIVSRSHAIGRHKAVIHVANSPAALEIRSASAWSVFAACGQQLRCRLCVAVHGRHHLCSWQARQQAAAACSRWEETWRRRSTGICSWVHKLLAWLLWQGMCHCGCPQVPCTPELACHACLQAAQACFCWCRHAAAWGLRHRQTRLCAALTESGPRCATR